MTFQFYFYSFIKTLAYFLMKGSKVGTEWHELDNASNFLEFFQGRDQWTIQEKAWLHYNPLDLDQDNVLKIMSFKYIYKGMNITIYNSFINSFIIYHYPPSVYNRN